MKLLFVSSVNLSTNPRIYKEIQLAYALNYDVTFIGFNLGNWSDKGDTLIKEKYPKIKFIYLEATRKNFFNWLYFSLLHILYRYIWKFSKQSLKVSGISHSKRTIPLQQALNGLATKYDLVIAHTLAALYPSFIFAKQDNCKFAFDVEDYHPGEKISTDAVNEKQRREILMKRILPLATYVTAASPLICKTVEELAPGVKAKTILNYFPESEFIEPASITNDKIKLIWFSQNINAGRGLELILTGWNEIRNNFELTLIGKIDSQFYNQWIKSHLDIIIKDPLSQQMLHHNLSVYDVGLAIDVDTDDYNRSLAITNKILAYYQAGLYILATDTRAQKDFINKNHLHGMFAEQTSSSIICSLLKIKDDWMTIKNMRKERFIKASLSSWENESQIIKNEWEKIRQQI